MRERSLELFGDEKRLEALLGGQMFWEGRLTLSLLRCRRVHPPSAWRQVGAGPWALVAEKHDTFYSLGQVLPADGPVGVLIYGSASTSRRRSPSFRTWLNRPRGFSISGT